MTNERDEDTSDSGDGGHGGGKDSGDLKAADAKDLHRAVREEGQAELDRPVSSLFWSGLAGGVVIVASLLTQGALHKSLPDAPWRDLVVSLGYPIGFVVVILGRMQLFTESTVTAMLPLVTTPSLRSLWRTLRLWGIVLAANLIGTMIVSAAAAYGWLGEDAGLRAGMIEVSMKVTELSAGATFINAIPAGILIAIVAWVLPNAREQSILVIFVLGFVVAAGHFSHSIVGSVEIFLLLFSGLVGVEQAVLGCLIPAIVGNLIGGAGIFALLAHAQVRGEMSQSRAGG